jgi:hypothetical protein
LKLELQKSQDNEEEIERKVLIIRDEIDIANEYKEKFKIRSTNLDEILQN